MIFNDFVTSEKGVDGSMISPELRDLLSGLLEPGKLLIKDTLLTDTDLSLCIKLYILFNQ